MILAVAVVALVVGLGLVLSLPRFIAESQIYSPLGIEASGSPARGLPETSRMGNGTFDTGEMCQRMAHPSS